MQTSPDAVIPSTAPPRTLYRADHIGPHHALASAAIPILFPPVRIDNELYLDGGLRQNTPIAPALRLGATHIFAIGGSREIKGVLAQEGVAPGVTAPGAAFLLGKILNAFLLDHVDVDIDLLTRLNNVLADGAAAYGPEFVDRMTQEAERHGRPAYRNVRCLALHPSEDIGRLASEHVQKGRFRGDPIVTKRLLTMLDLGGGTEADLASYLLFDGTFCRQLIEMGRADAKARRDELLSFFGDAADDGGRDEGDDSGRWEKRSATIPIGT
jgi:NTE family protein